MKTLTNNVIRLGLDVLSFDAPKDSVRQQWVQFWRCNDIAFQIGCFSGESLLDISEFGIIYLSLRALDEGCPPSGGSPALLLKSTDEFDASLTLDDWQSGTKQHAVISFSAQENALSAGEYWMSIWAVTKSEQHTITLGSGVCKVLENGGISTTPPEPVAIYYTAAECDERFAEKGITGGESSGSEGGEFSGVMPIEKGTLIVGDGQETQILSPGEKSQILIADPDKNCGVYWGNYPWQFITSYNVTDAVEEILFERVFSSERCLHYKLLYDFIDTSEVGARLQMQYGYEQDGSVYWENDNTEYVYNTADFSGSVSKYGSYTATDSFFAFGNENSIYRNSGGSLFGELDFWNDGNPKHIVQANTRVSSFRIYNGNWISNCGFYNFVYRNIGKHIINSFRLTLDSGSYISGRFLIYGIR